MLTRPRPVFRARRASTPPGFGCARLATLASAPPHPGGVEAEGRKTNYRKSFTPPSEGKPVFSSYAESVAQSDSDPRLHLLMPEHQALGRTDEATGSGKRQQNC